MSTRIRRYFFVLICAFLFFTIVHCQAYATLYSIDAVSDAGQYPGQPDSVSFVMSNGTTANVPASTNPPFASAAAVYSYASAQGYSNWTLESIGNIWNSSQTTVGVTTPLLAAGTYQISVAGGAFTYDSFNWDTPSSYYEQWLWFLNIGSDIPVTVGGVTSQVYNSYTLGSSTMYADPAAATAANQNAFIDITLTGAGYLSFWVYDTNSIDNAGSLQVDLTSVPLPSSLLLLVTGLPILVRRIRQRMPG